MNFLYINKPVDWTSHDVVAYLRGVLNTKKIGHAGTLDPFATGLLIVGVGRESTKRLDEWKGKKKVYETILHLGATSNTQDKTGEITEVSNSQPTKEEIQTTINQFVGTQEQTPPMFSAKKVKGEKLYELARKGIEIERKPVEITVYTIELLDYTYPQVSLRVECSTGTYIRTLCHDIGQSLKTGAYCEELTRTKIGDITLDQAMDVTEVKPFQNQIDNSQIL